MSHSPQEISKLKDQIDTLKNDLNTYQGYLDQAMTAMSAMQNQYNDDKEEMDNVEKKINGFGAYKDKELNDYKIEICLDQAQSEYERIENEIKAAIEKTSVDEKDVGKALTLAHDLLAVLFKNQDRMSRLNSALKSFGLLIERSGSPKLTVEQYFNVCGMSQFVSMLNENQITTMDQLICKDDASFEDIMKIIENGLNQQHNQWEDSGKYLGQEEPTTKLSLKQSRFFKKVCLNPKVWESDQTQKIEIVKESLNAIAPLLIDFLDQIDKILKQTELESVFASKDEEKDDININVNASKEELLKEFEYESQKVTKEDAALQAVGSQTKIIIDSMISKYQDPKSNHKHRPRALELAHGIEEMCRDIGLCIKSISEALNLTSSILELQPENLTKKSESLWNAVDLGMKQIFVDASKMDKMGEEFFLFFDKFKQGLNDYLSSSYKDNDLLAATESLRKDIKEFEDLIEDFGKQVKNLNDGASKCIDDFIYNSIGSKEFEQSRKEREVKMKDYLSKKEKYDVREYELACEYLSLMKKKNELESFLSNTMQELNEGKEPLEQLKSQVSNDKIQIHSLQTTLALWSH